jgi:glycosyltransferase involved in cell wall biosynthesis
MLNGKKIIVVLPAYNAENTLEQTYQEIPLDIVDQVLMVDDHSVDNTVSLAKRLGIETISHDRNYGYGRNQKTCYREALRHNADIVIMVHPDYQYTPKLITAMVSMIAYGVYDVVLGSRILGGKGESDARQQIIRIPHRLSGIFQESSRGSPTE